MKKAHVTCNLFLETYRIKVFVLDAPRRGAPKECDDGKLNTQGLYGIPTHTLGNTHTHTHAKEAPLGLYNLRGRDRRIHTHEELRE